MSKKPSGKKAAALIRFVVALAVLALFVWAYLAPSLAANAALEPLVKSQFSAALAGAGLIGSMVFAILALTLIFGRLYCGVLCPLGTAQELFWRIGKLLRGKSPPRSGRASASSATPSTGGSAPRNAPRFFRGGYSKASKIRYIIPLLVAAGIIFSFTPLMVIVDPISTFGRGMSAVRGLLSGSAAGFAFAVPFILILIIAFFRGRAFCAWCPVGVTLGLFSKAALLGIKLTPACVSCGLCDAACPTGCIDAAAKRVDTERCVLCFSCTAACPTDSASYGVRGRAAFSGESRRGFLNNMVKTSLGVIYLLAPSLKLSARSTKTEAETDDEDLPILPPGAKNAAHFESRCIACHACVAACPAHIIAAAEAPFPAVTYNGDATAACQFNCVECGRVCPTGAIARLSIDEKHRTRIALSTLYFERCVVNTKHESCGACAEVCPTGALTMAAYIEPGIPFLTRPIYDERYCLGCGACLAACPAEPRAFTLAAVAKQSLTVGSRPLEESGDELLVEDTGDFPF